MRKRKIIISLLLALALTFSLSITAYAVDSGSVENVVAEVEDGSKVVVDIGAYLTAYAAGAGDLLYDYLAGTSAVTITGVRSGDKYIDIGQYISNYASYMSVAGAVSNSPGLAQIDINDYKLLVGMNGTNPILEAIFVADLTAYTTVLAAVVEADYTAASWTAYQEVVAANVVTTANTQTEVNAATAAIVAAQANLVIAPSQAAMDLANKMEATYIYLETTDKTQVGNVRTALTALTDDQLNGVIEPLLNTVAVGKFTNRAEAQAQIRKFIRGFGQIYYSADKTTLATTLDQFKLDNTDLFTKIFGNTITADQLYSLLIAAQDELPTVIQASDDPLTLFTKSDAEIKTLWPTYAKTAIRSAIQKPAFTDFYGKLGLIGWSAEDLIDQQKALSLLIDTNNNSELILGKAYIRSQTKLISGETALTLGTAPVSATYNITIMGLGGSSTAAAKVLWSSSNPTVASFDSTLYKNKLSAHVAGTTEIKAYRDVVGANPDTDWILKFTVTVQ